MASDDQQLRATLNQLRDQLADAQAIDPQLADRLRETVTDIEATLEGQPPERRHRDEDHRSLRERLSEAALEFEASHPTLSMTIGSLADALARIGI